MIMDKFIKREKKADLIETIILSVVFLGLFSFIIYMFVRAI